VSAWATGSDGDGAGVGVGVGVGDIPDTEYAFVGDTEQAAFERAEQWLHERYDVHPSKHS
jgi:hypothetical protein